jgi:hypothetical protein
MTPRHDDHDDRLRTLFEDAVSDVEPRGGLDAIRSRTKVSPMRARPWYLGVGAAVVATAATITAIAVVGSDVGTPTGDPGFADSPSAGSPSTDPEGDGTPQPSPSTKTSSPPTTQIGAVPVYYVGDTPMGPRLYREFHRGEGVDALSVALEHAVGRTPDDPDYSVPWPTGTSVTGSFDGIGDDGQITLDVNSPDGSALRVRQPGMSRETAEMAIQQLVYTAQAATQTTAPVQFLLDGERTHTLLDVPVVEPLARADQLSTLSLVIVSTPAEGAEVSGSFRAEGIASSFEATVPWQLRRGDEVVKEGFSTAAGWMDRLYPWQTDPIDVSDLEPGEYTFVAMTDDPSGGAEGPGAFADTRTLLIR